jgi:hypothetical protein
MDIIGFLYISLVSNTVQVGDAHAHAHAHVHVQRLVSVVKMVTELENILPTSSVLLYVF